MLCSTTF
ncbi:hypothetical protein D018_3162A, partial [Vibrio parahaemolyticus VP2007-007]